MVCVCVWTWVWGGHGGVCVGGGGSGCGVDVVVCVLGGWQWVWGGCVEENGIFKGPPQAILFGGGGGIPYHLNEFQLEQ